MEGFLGGSAYARECAHGKGVQKEMLGARRHAGEASGLLALRGDLGYRFGGSQANGAGDAQGCHRFLDAPSDGHRMLVGIAARGDVKESLVYGDLLYQGSLGFDEGHHLTAHFPVALVASRRPYSLGA